MHLLCDACRSYALLTARREGSWTGRAPLEQSDLVDLAWFEDVVAAALDEIPEPIAAQLDNLTVVVEEEPSRRQDPDGDGLLGLYEGVSLAERGIDYFGVMPDIITIFRGPHLRLGLSERELAAEVRTTVLHEIGHHLGIDDDRLHELGWA